MENLSNSYFGRRFLHTLMVILAAVYAAPAAAQSTDASKAGTFYFGFQAIPEAVGLSLKYRLTDTVVLQGVLQPDADDTAAALRVYRSIQKSDFWESWVFGSYARSRHEYQDFDFADGTARETTVRETQSVFSVGIGVEWNWQGRNRNLPPLLPSLELGAGIDEDSDLGLVLGFGFHYRF